jgi:L-ascorbate metabolism protein UlaG (beta-lactamase superfamily)
VGENIMKLVSDIQRSRLGNLTLLAALAMAAVVPIPVLASTDINHDAIVDFLDYAILANSWLQEAPEQTADFREVETLADHWLEGAVPIAYVQWLGHSSVKVWAEDKVVYVDPRNLDTAPHDATVVLVTHTHSDHYAPADIAKVSNADTIFMAPPDVVAAYGKGQAVAPGVTIELSGLRITTIPAYNISTTNHPKSNNWLGYIVEFGPQRIYVAGDTDLTDEMKALQDIDVAFLPAGGTYTMNAVQAAEATKYVNPVVAIPYHWGEVVGTLADAQTFARMAACNAKVMTKGEILGSMDWGTDFSLIAHWRLDELNGVIASDSVGSADAAVYGEPLWQPTGGKIVGALQLDGLDDYLSTPYVIDPSSGPFAVSAWVKGGLPGQTILSQVGGANWLTSDGTTGALGTELKGTGRNTKALWSQTPITDGNWHRVGLVCDGTNRTLYIDGVEAANDTAASPVLSKGGLYIGAGASLQVGTFWSGLIDDVRVHNHAVAP